MSKQQVIILAGIHGNEPGPSIYMQRAVKDPAFWSGLVNKVTVFPDINPYGLVRNKRHDERNVDLNRAWHYTKGPASIKLQVIKDKIRSASLVLDFHEAWGFHRCNNSSLGQSIFIPRLESSLNGIPIKELAETAVRLLNESVSGSQDDCDKWDVRTTIPPVTGDCSSYCAKIGVPHVLIEMAGQNNVRSLKRRLKNTEIILSVFLGKSMPIFLE